MTQQEMNRQILSDPKRRKEVAYHEAAHFITLIAYSKQVIEYPAIIRVSIDAEESQNLGYIRYRPMFIGGAESAKRYLQIDDPETIRICTARIRGVIKQILAGPVSDYLHSDYYQDGELDFYLDEFWSSGSGDLEQASPYFKLLDTNFGDADDIFSDVPSILKIYFEETLTDINNHWQAIQEVGEILYDKLVLEGDELAELVNSYYDSLDVESIL